MGGLKGLPAPEGPRSTGWARCGGVSRRGVAGYGSRKIGGGGTFVLGALEKTGRTTLPEVFAACISPSRSRPSQRAGRRGPPSLWTATSGIAGTGGQSLPCLSCIFPCRAEPRIDNQPGRFGCKQAPPTANVAARVSGYHLNGVAHKNSNDSSSTW